MKHKLFDGFNCKKVELDSKIMLSVDKHNNARNYDPESEEVEKLQMNDLLLLVIKEQEKNQNTIAAKDWQKIL